MKLIIFVGRDSLKKNHAKSISARDPISERENFDRKYIIGNIWREKTSHRPLMAWLFTPINNIRFEQYNTLRVTV